ncbi:TetR family transcriptional regulator [Vibrio sp. Hep-1b-8]|uniref:TetR/AcrR family transcriptional regulator n=1 Tax=Vibrio sp. Hep-1b-8 TaxID=2144187 RepID=UPI001110CED2|nr:TetR family transcriptional regulator [Vibrio sp. Hep-1b-8]TMX45314.1 TetR family transcriptional regulator [Vibrio sp. Hep-1b-8]
MTTKPRKAGRPSDSIDARQQLIHQARELFTVMAYDKVSTRLIANRAGVNVAMIRYYFGNKEGLFETMLRETLEPMRRQMQVLLKESSQKNFLDISQPMQQVMFMKLVEGKILRPDADPKLCKVSYISLMVFPFIAPPALLAIHGIELNEAFLDRLLEHNIKLMTHGFLQSNHQQD